jgi:hypothetical protein
VFYHIATRREDDLAPAGLSDVVNGLASWKQLIPDIHILHAEAVWQVYRARTELSFHGQKMKHLESLLDGTVPL